MHVLIFSKSINNTANACRLKKARTHSAELQCFTSTSSTVIKPYSASPGGCTQPRSATYHFIISVIGTPVDYSPYLRSHGDGERRCLASLRVFVPRNERGTWILSSGGRAGSRPLHRCLLCPGHRNRGCYWERPGHVCLFLVSGGVKRTSTVPDIHTHTQMLLL